MTFTKSLLIVFILLYLTSASTWGQYIPSPGTADILLGLKKLQTVGSVLYVAAHPDDENTRLLAYLAKEKNLRTGYISMTRGDGGQNLIGKEQGELLGLIRTQELLAARRSDGAEQFFTRANDFGYSKNPEETFRFWNKDSILGDLVWVIRNFKPDVIICRFPTTGEGGHGHHTASALLAVEAFEAAADPARYPEQLAYTNIWKAKRIFFNSFNFGGTNTTSADQLKMDVGTFNPLLGKGYGEIAAESRSFHKSQGFGSARGRGSVIEYFKQLQGDSAMHDIFERIDQTWNRLPGTGTISALIDEALAHYKADKPAASVPELVKIFSSMLNWNGKGPEGDYWKAIKLKEIESLILACSGLWLEAAATDYSGIPGEPVSMNLQVIKRNDLGVTLQKISFFGKSDTITSLSLKFNELYSFGHQEIIPEQVNWSSPYWLNEPHDAGRYMVRNRQWIGKPENPAALMVSFDLEIGGIRFTIDKPLIFKSTDPVKGEVYRPFEILPPATIQLQDKVFVFDETKARTIQVVVEAHTSKVQGTLEIQVPDGWNLKMNDRTFNLTKKGDEAILEGILTPPGNASTGKLKASLLINGRSYTKSIHRIEFDHIPYQFTLTDADFKLVKLNLQKSKGSIGYIPGAGDEIPSCLKQLGYEVVTLTDDFLSNADLSVYSAIVTGIRAYNTNDRLQVHYSRLMDYIKQGGNLVVQYNTNNRIGPVLAKIGPYPFTISRDRVTDETAAVTYADPGHPALLVPNKIESNDFNDWVQERGIYFATEMDSAYKAVLSMKDPGEKESNGSLIIAPYGKGNFVYTGLAFFRELPAGVPGAYRLFVNLLSLPRHE